MDWVRREFLKLGGIATLVAPAMLSRGARSAIAPMPSAGTGTVFDVRSFGAVGDGKTIDSPAINRAIEAAGATGGMVYVPAGTYACYSLRLASAVALYVEQGATILAADTPRSGTASGYDPAESNAPWEAFQDFGHNHWHNSLIWGENLHDVAVLGPGLIWGRGLGRIVRPAPDHVAIIALGGQAQPMLDEPEQGLPDTAEFGHLVEDEDDGFLDTAIGILLEPVARLHEANRGGDDKFTPAGLLVARRQ